MRKPRRTQGSPRGARGASEPPQRTPRTQEGRPGEPKRRHWGPRAAPGEPKRRPGGPRAAPGKPKRRHGGPRAAPKDPKRHQSGPGAGPGGAKGGEKSIPGGPRTPKDAQARPCGRPQEAKGPPEEAPRTLLHASGHPPRTLGAEVVRLSDAAILTRSHVKNHWFFIHFRASKGPPRESHETLVFTSLERGHPRRACTKPLLFRASKVNGRNHAN